MRFTLLALSALLLCPLGHASTVPATLSSGVIKLKVGEKARLTCPADTAYGPKGRDAIPPNSTLIFEIELLAIEK